MAFADPQIVTISGAGNTLPRVGSGINTGSFAKEDGLLKLSAAHVYGKRTRRTLRLEHSKIAPDPLVSSTNIRYSMSSYIVCDLPVTGYTVAEAKAVIDGLTLFLTATSGSKLTQLLGGES